MIKIFCNFMDGDHITQYIKQYPEVYDKPITLLIDHPPQSQEQLNINPYNFFITAEPNQLFNIHDWVVNNYTLFNCILTGGQNVLDNCSNACFFPFGISWLEEEYINNVDDINKKFEVSFLCGGKQMIEGHHLRHRLHKRENEITIPKQWYYTLPDYNYNDGHHTIVKYEGKGPGHEKLRLWESMFSICVENSSNRGYHTEKIIDAFLSKTIPVYWGCPNLEELGYNMDGVIYCSDENEIIEKTNKLTSDDYHNKKTAIEHNFELAKHYANFNSRLVKILDEIIKINNI